MTSQHAVGRGLRPRLPALRRARAAAAPRTRWALWRLDGAPGARPAAVVAPEGAARGRCSASPPSPPSSTSASRYVTRDTPLGEIDFEFITYRDYVGVSTMLLLFVAVTRARRRLPRPPRPGAAADLRPARSPATTTSLAKVGAIVAIVFGFCVHPPGRAVRRPDAGARRRRPRLRRRQRRGAVAGAGRRWPILALYYAVIGVAAGVADRPADRRRPSPSSAPARHLDRRRRRRRGRAAGGEDTLIGGSSTCSACRCSLRDLVFVGQVDVDQRRRPRRASPGRRARRRRSLYAGDRRGRRSPSSTAATARPAVSDGVPPAAPAAARSTRPSSPTPPSWSPGVSVWFGQKVALTELSCSFGPGVTGLLGPNGAGKTTLMRAHRAACCRPTRATVRVAGRDPRTRPRGAAPHRPRARGRRRARPAHRPPARRATRRRCTRCATAPRPSAAWPPSACSTSPTAGSAGFSKGMRQRAKIAAALVTGPVGARARRAAQRRRPGAAGRPHRAVPRASATRAAPSSSAPTCSTRSSAWPAARS